MSGVFYYCSEKYKQDFNIVYVKEYEWIEFKPKSLNYTDMIITINVKNEDVEKYKQLKLINEKYTSTFFLTEVHIFNSKYKNLIFERNTFEDGIRKIFEIGVPIICTRKTIDDPKYFYDNPHYLTWDKNYPSYMEDVNITPLQKPKSYISILAPFDQLFLDFNDKTPHSLANWPYLTYIYKSSVDVPNVEFDKNKGSLLSGGLEYRLKNRSVLYVSELFSGETINIFNEATFLKKYLINWVWLPEYAPENGKAYSLNIFKTLKGFTRDQSTHTITPMFNNLTYNVYSDYCFQLKNYRSGYPLNEYIFQPIEMNIIEYKVPTIYDIDYGKDDIYRRLMEPYVYYVTGKNYIKSNPFDVKQTLYGIFDSGMKWIFLGDKIINNYFYETMSFVEAPYTVSNYKNFLTSNPAYYEQIQLQKNKESWSLVNTFLGIGIGLATTIFTGGNIIAGGVVGAAIMGAGNKIISQVDVNTGPTVNQTNALNNLTEKYEGLKRQDEIDAVGKGMNKVLNTIDATVQYSYNMKAIDLQIKNVEENRRLTLSGGTIESLMATNTSVPFKRMRLHNYDQFLFDVKRLGWIYNGLDNTKVNDREHFAIAGMISELNIINALGEITPIGKDFINQIVNSFKVGMCYWKLH